MTLALTRITNDHYYRLMSAQVDELVDLSADPVLFAIQGVDKMHKALTSSSRAGFLEIISSSRARMRAYSSRGVLARGGKIGWLTCSRADWRTPRTCSSITVGNSS